MSVWLNFSFFVFKESYDRARNLIKTHHSELKSLASALMKYETLDADDTKTILEGKKLASKKSWLTQDYEYHELFLFSCV